MAKIRAPYTNKGLIHIGDRVRTLEDEEGVVVRTYFNRRIGLKAIIKLDDGTVFCELVRWLRKIK